MAKLNFRYGAMNCGKSDSLIGTAYNYTENGLAVVTVMPETMMRSDKMMTSRSGKEWPVDIIAQPETELRQAVLSRQLGSSALQCVLVDEATFLTVDQVNELEKIAKIDQISVIAAGLRTNIQRQLFPAAKRFFELSDDIKKLPTMCTCGSQAEFNGRFVDGVFHVGEPIVLVDNDPSRVRYQSMCANCYDQSYHSEGAIVA